MEPTEQIIFSIGNNKSRLDFLKYHVRINGRNMNYDDLFDVICEDCDELIN